MTKQLLQLDNEAVNDQGTRLGTFSLTFRPAYGFAKQTIPWADAAGYAAECVNQAVRLSFLASVHNEGVVRLADLKDLTATCRRYMSLLKAHEEAGITPTFKIDESLVDMSKSMLPGPECLAD